MNFYRPPTLQGVQDALGSLSKALRAWKFYPQGHPSRKNSITLAHAQMQTMLDGHNLSLNSGRTDFSFPDGESLKDPTRMSSNLSYELFIRRVLKVTFMADLSLDDLLAFIRLLTLPPETILQSGGMEKLMVDSGIRTIWTNEFDLSVITARRRSVEAGTVVPHSLDDIEAGRGELPETPMQETSVEFVDSVSPLRHMELLIGRLAVTESDEQYFQLLRQAMACSRDLMEHQELRAMVPLVELLTVHSQEPERSEALRKRALYGIEQIARDERLLGFFLNRLEHADKLSHDAALSLVRAAGQGAVIWAVERLGSTENLTLRKSLSMLLAGVGEAAVPAILSRIDDPRWYVVRNLVNVLGYIGSLETLEYLRVCLFHPDVRVSKEAVRSLAKIGGETAEAILVSVLRGEDHQLFPQVMASLGGMRSAKGLSEMMKIVTRWDPLLKNLHLKLDALQAIGVIKDCQVVPELVKVLTGSHVLVPGKWEQFKSAIAATLAHLGDVRAVPALESLAARNGKVAQACQDALASIDRSEREQHDVA